MTFVTSSPRRRLAAVALLALAVVVAAVLISQPGRESDATAAAPASNFDGIPQDGIALGSPKAPAVLTEFADLQCPFCAAYARDVLPTVVDRYVRSGRLRLELHVLTFLGEDSVRAGAMAAAAAQQDKLWPFADAFYRSQGAENSGYATDDFLRGIGEATPGSRRRPGLRRALGREGDGDAHRGRARGRRRGRRPHARLLPAPRRRARARDRTGRADRRGVHRRARRGAGAMSRLTAVVAVLSLVGAAIAGYLTWVHFAELQPFCVGGGGGCERVQSSAYAKLAGVPVAVIGLAGYLAVLASLALPDGR